RRHVREPSGRGSGADHDADDRHARAVRRHRELRGPDGLLRAAAQPRQAVRRHARHRARELPAEELPHPVPHLARLLQPAGPGLPRSLTEDRVNQALVAACFVLASLAATIALVAPATAQPKAFAPDPVDMAAAKREAAVTWYTSTPVNTAQRIANMFQTETGIKVELFRSGGSAVLRRFMQELDARRGDGGRMD